MLDARFARSWRKRLLSPFWRRFSVLSWAPLLAAVATLGAAPAARAADHELSRVTATTLSQELGGAALLFTGAALALPTPEHCRWCAPPRFDESLAIPVAPEDRRVAGRMSHVFSYAVIPALMTSALLVPPLTTSESNDHAYQNLSIAGEVVLVDLALTIVIKKWIARRRPAFYYRRTAYTEYGPDSREPNLSFFSGDTSAAFAAASAAATISFQRGYRSAPYVTAAGATFAAATGLLRSAADVHWPSDVLTGALVGTGLGVALPLLLHPRKDGGDASATAGTPVSPAGPPDATIVRLSGAF